MKIYITKYWETKGIIKANAKPGHYDPSYMSVEGFGNLFSKIQYANTPEEAEAQVKKKVAKKIAFLEKKIATLKEKYA